MKLNRQTLRRIILKEIKNLKEGINLPDPTNFPKLDDDDEDFDDFNDYEGVQDSYATPPARINLGRPQVSDVDVFREFLEAALRTFNNPVNVTKRNIPNTVEYYGGTEYTDAAGNIAALRGKGVRAGDAYISIKYIPPGKKAYYKNLVGFEKSLTVPQFKALISRLKNMSNEEKERFLNDSINGLGGSF